MTISLCDILNSPSDRIWRPTDKKNLVFPPLYIVWATQSVMDDVSPVIEHIAVYGRVNSRRSRGTGKGAEAQHLEIFVELSVAEEI